jgi:ATP-dependent helicase/nuclease subunit B
MIERDRHIPRRTIWRGGGTWQYACRGRYADAAETSGFRDGAAMARIRLLCGSDRSDRRQRIDTVFREAEGRALLVLPARNAAMRRREDLLLADNRGFWGNPVRDLTDFVVSLIEAEGIAVRPVNSFERRMLIEECLAGLPETAGLEDGPGPENAGFVTHLLRVITGLKQAAIEPEVFRNRISVSGGISPFDGLVAAAYEAYQARLRAAGLWDVPGLYWEADLICRGKEPALLASVDVLALDGFDDFTPSELRLLRNLTPHLDELVFGLNYDEMPSRRDLYRLPERAMNAIRRDFPAVQLETFETPPPVSYHEFAADQLFWRSPPEMPAGLAPGLAIVPCADMLHELESIGRRIKTLLIEKAVAPSSIAVVFRNLASAADLLRLVFGEFGIPARVLHHPPLLESGPGAFLARLIEAVSAWRRDDIAAVLASPWFGGEEAAAGYVHAGVLAAQAGIIEGFDTWQRRLGRLAARMREDKKSRAAARRAGIADPAAAIAAVQARLTRLHTLTEPLNRPQSQRDFALAIDRLLDNLAMEKTADALEDPDQANSAGDALHGLRRMLSAMAHLDSSQKPVNTLLLRRRLEQGLREYTFRVPAAAGGVVCIDAPGVRNLTFDHVFFCGLIEGITPAPAPANALYGDDELRGLEKAGIQLETRNDHSFRERLLFHHVLASARESITLTGSVLKEDGREATPSPFLMEVRGLFPAGISIEEDLPRADSFLPAETAIASRRDLRNTAFYRNPAMKAFAGDTAAIEKGAAIEKLRRGQTPFDAWDGVLSDAALKAVIASRYDEKHLFSVNQIEKYIACPFRFFAERLLGLEDQETPDIEFDPLVRGLILHTALESFHRAYRGRHTTDIPEEEAREFMNRMVEAAFEKHAWRSLNAPESLTAVEMRRMKNALERYLEISRKDGETAWKPAYFEAVFGGARGDEAEDLEKEEPFVLETGTGPVRFAGRIDRIDRHENLARIIDYKSSGTPSSGDITSGRSIQLTVYAMALEALLLPGAVCDEAWFVVPGRTAAQKGLNREGRRDWPNREENVLRAIADAVAGIREGAFPPAPGKSACAWCPIKDVCRHDKTRVERKIQSTAAAGSDA